MISCITLLLVLHKLHSKKYIHTKSSQILPCPFHDPLTVQCIHHLQRFTGINTRTGVKHCNMPVVSAVGPALNCKFPSRRIFTNHFCNSASGRTWPIFADFPKTNSWPYLQMLWALSSDIQNAEVPSQGNEAWLRLLKPASRSERIGGDRNMTT